MDGGSLRKKLKAPHKQFGAQACDLPQNQLPTNGQVIGKILKLRQEEMKARNVTENLVSVHTCISSVVREVEALWVKASIPTQHRCQIVEKMRRLWSTKNYLRKSKVTAGSRKTQKGVDMSALFDIANRSQLPELQADREFLEDQRGARRQVVGEVDFETSELWKRRGERARKAATSQKETEKQGDVPTTFH